MCRSHPWQLFYGDSDPFDSLYILNRLAVGIGEAGVPPALKALPCCRSFGCGTHGNRPAASNRIAQIATDLRKIEATIEPEVMAVIFPPGIRWARQQNYYFVRGARCGVPGNEYGRRGQPYRRLLMWRTSVRRHRILPPFAMVSDQESASASLASRSAWGIRSTLIPPRRKAGSMVRHNGRCCS